MPRFLLHNFQFRPKYISNNERAAYSIYIVDMLEEKIPRICVLQKRLTASTVLTNGGVLLPGRRTSFSEGTQLLVCGTGYDEHTLTVSWDESYYFVRSEQLKEALKHLSDSDWLEFALEMVSIEQKEAMQGHLDRGCDSCEKTLDTWRKVLELSQKNALYTPPLTAVLAAKALFQAEKWWKWLPQFAEFARLVFDSSRQPIPAGVRGSATLTRHILQETDSFAIDLRLEYESPKKGVALTGQILNSKKPSQPIQKSHIVLLRQNALVAEKTTSVSGEFDLVYDDEEGLNLFLNIPGQKPIGISLPSGSI
jgi:hypothetical protein